MNPDRVFRRIGKALRSRGVKVVFVKGWKQRGRPGTYNPRGVMFHHTASNRNGGDAPALGTVVYGRPDVVGPLSQFVVGRSGTVYVVAKGRANHAGLGGPIKGIPKDSGNTYLIGIECENDGIGEPWPNKQLHAIRILHAVLLRRMNRKARMCIGHKEYTSRKIDPAGVDMKAFRRRLRRTMRKLWPVWFQRRFG